MQVLAQYVADSARLRLLSSGDMCCIILLKSMPRCGDLQEEGTLNMEPQIV